MKETPEREKKEPEIPEPRSAKELAQAMFLLADEKLPPGKRRLTESLVTKSSRSTESS